MWILPGIVGILLLLAGCAFKSSALGPTYEVVLDDLSEPRGLWLRADGTLCVAEAGGLAAGQEVGQRPATLQANTGALTCLNSEGQREQIARNLPYVLYTGDGVSVGPTDVAEIDGLLYLLTGEGYGRLSRRLLRVGKGEPRQTVANFEHIPGHDVSEDYFNPTAAASNPYAMVPDPANQRFLVTDGATGRVLAAGLDGRIRVYSVAKGHEVLTGIAWGPDGLLYVASFSQLPHRAGAGAILSVQPDGTAAVVLSNLTMPIDLAFDKLGHLYVLEFADGAGSSGPYRNTKGRLLRFVRQGYGWAAGQVLVEALPYPTAMLFGPDDSLYLSIHGAFSPSGSGAVLRFDKLACWTQAQLPLHYSP
jgi:hypothetical protein